MLEQVLGDSTAKVKFWWDDSATPSIIFVDTAKLVKNCTLGPFYGRQVIFSNDVSDVERKESAYVILRALELKKRSGMVVLLYKNTGALGIFKFRRKNKILSLVKVEIGYF
jgi:hypothetical protein